MSSRVEKCSNVSPLRIYWRRPFFAHTRTSFRVQRCCGYNCSSSPATILRAPYFAIETGPHFVLFGLCDVVEDVRDPSLLPATTSLNRRRISWSAVLGVTRCTLFSSEIVFFQGETACDSSSVPFSMHYLMRACMRRVGWTHARAPPLLVDRVCICTRPGRTNVTRSQQALRCRKTDTVYIRFVQLENPNSRLLFLFTRVQVWIHMGARNAT